MHRRFGRLGHPKILGLLALTILFVLPLIAGPAAAAAPAMGSSSVTATEQWDGSPASWALGVVIPEGSGLEGGGALKWQSVTNVTAVVQLPDIIRPDRPVYAVLSAMTANGSVLQLATGIYTNSTSWFVYSELVTNVESSVPTYHLLHNSSLLQIAPSSILAVSLFQSPSGRWEYKVVDEGSGLSTSGLFPSGIAPQLKEGGQEVFALESYSTQNATFAHMGNLTLRSVFLGGRRVASGPYEYSDWSPSHDPLFAVGTSGANPPVFVSLQCTDEGAWVWSYDDPSASTAPAPQVGGPSGEYLMALLLVGGLAVAAVSFWLFHAGLLKVGA